MVCVAGNYCDLPGSGCLVSPAPATQMIPAAFSKVGHLAWNELPKCNSMARDVGDSCRSLDGSLSKEVQKELGILDISLKQCALDCLGSTRPSVCAYCFAVLPCLLEYQGNCEE